MTPNIKTLRLIHHEAARLMATGMKQVEVARATGLTQNRLSILKQDPAFAGLLAHYSAGEEEVFHEARERMALLGLDTVSVLHERVVDESDDLSTKDLVSIAEMALDRGGLGPVQKSVNVTGTLSADDVAALRAGLGNATLVEREGQDFEQAPNATIELEPKPSSSPDLLNLGAPPTQPRDRAATALDGAGESGAEALPTPRRAAAGQTI